MQIMLIVAQIAVLLVIGLLLWQIWRFLKRNDVPDDEPLGEERAKFMTLRLKWIAVCIGLEAVLQIASAILRFFEVI